ncbi:MAG TPA: hypothetical protein DGF10_04790 [Acidimicrobiaceae bacterium]|nr:hypothetical protein [Acidimicrobiaceae bacterium]|tara:strand:+ start:171 stop:539 length:369 start_codon:yes stop_codon:yes gene_type:complete
MAVRINRQIISATTLTGFLAGSFIASAENNFSRDGVLSGWEALVTFVLLPLLAALLVSIGLRRRHLAPRLIVVAYLTLAIPLFGISAGGANVLQQMLGGIIGGSVWGLFFAIRRFPRDSVSK